MSARSGSRLLLAAATALALAAAGCGGGDDAGAPERDEGAASSSTTAPVADYGGAGGSPDGGATGAGTIVAVDFSFEDAAVAPGDDLVLRNDGDATHTATADDGSFDTGEVGGGETSAPATAPEEPGDYAFRCQIHPSMTATLTVGS